MRTGNVWWRARRSRTAVPTARMTMRYSGERTCMQQDEAVTVVIPTKDRPGLLPMTVASVLGQHGVDVRVLVVDDGSATPVSEMLAPDARLRLMRNDRSRGVSGARNRGLAEVTTPWTAFLDDDDLWAPSKLRRQLDAVAGTECRWACSASVSFAADHVLDVTDPPANGDLSTALLHGNIISGSASGVLVRTDLVRAVGGFDESLPSMEDWDLWIRLAQESPLATVSSPDVGYRVHRTSRGHDLDEQPAALRLMQRKYATRTPPLSVEPDVYLLEYWARMAYNAGDWRAGLRRTVDLVARRGHYPALRTPARAVLPEALQRRLRAQRMARHARRRPEQDWEWLTPYLRPGPSGARRQAEPGPESHRS